MLGSRLALCFGDQTKIMQHIWITPFSIIDVNLIPEAALTSRPWAGTLEFIMRNRFKQHLIAEFKKIAMSINQMLD